MIGKLLKKIINIFKRRNIIYHFNDNNYPKSFEGYKKSRTEVLSEQRDDFSFTTPRDVLIRTLRKHDDMSSGEIESVVIITNFKVEDKQKEYKHSILSSAGHLETTGLIAWALKVY